MAAETALALVAVAIPFVFIMIGKELEFLSLNNVPIGKFLCYLMAAWFCVPILNLGVKFNETNTLELTRTIGVYYWAVMIILITITSLVVIGLLFYAVKKIAERT